MARIINKLFILIFLLIASPCFGATYTVTQTGAGADYSAATFNSESGDFSDDTFYFSGTITTRIIPAIYGTSGHPVILDGYQAGDFDPWGGGTDNCILSGSTAGVRIAGGLDYITVQDFRATGGGTSYAIMSVYNTTSSTNVSIGITFQRNYVYDANLNLFLAYTIVGGNGYQNSSYLTLDGNRMVGYGKSTDATQGLNFARADDLVLKNNEFGGGGASNCTSDNVIEFHDVNRGLVEYNYIHSAYNQSGIAIKELSNLVNNDVIVRFNKFYNNGSTTDNGRGISLTMNAGYSNHDIYLYGNYIYSGADFGIDIHRGNYNVHVWSNIISNNDRNGIILWTASGYLPEHDIFIYNNTIYGNETDDTGSTEEDRTGIGIRESSADDIFIKNNILMNNRPNATTYQQWASSSTIGAGESDYNTLYYTGQTASYYYDSAIRTLATMQEGTYSLETNSEIADPGFTNAAGSDFTLTAAGTPGVDLSQQFQVTVQGVTYTMNYHDGLDPDNTDWTTMPPTVATVDRNNYQWNRGAYVYFSETGSPAPVITSSADGATNACPQGADPISANFWLITDIASYCKGGIKSTTCAGDYPDGYDDAGLTAYDNPGGTNHGLFQTVACGAAHTVCAVCSDTLAAGGNESDWTEITRTVSAEEGINPPVALTIHSDTSGAVQVTIHSDTSGGVDVTPY